MEYWPYREVTSHIHPSLKPIEDAIINFSISLARGPYLDGKRYLGIAFLLAQNCNISPLEGRTEDAEVDLQSWHLENMTLGLLFVCSLKRVAESRSEAQSRSECPSCGQYFRIKSTNWNPKTF